MSDMTRVELWKAFAGGDATEYWCGSGDEHWTAAVDRLLAAARSHIEAEALREAAEAIADAPHPVYATWADIAGLLRSRADRIDGGSDD